MRTILTFMLAMLTFGAFAQEQAVPTIHILPEDIQQDSIEMGQVGTNRYIVRFVYTEAGAKKMLAFHRKHAGHEVVTQVGSFERRGREAPLSLRSEGWTEEGWLKRRTDKFFGMSEDDAKKIVEGLRKKSASEEIPLPKVTRFDQNPKARSAYLEAYRVGYQAPHELGLCNWGLSNDEVEIAQLMGRYDGQLAAQEAQELKRTSIKSKESLR